MTGGSPTSPTPAAAGRPLPSLRFRRIRALVLLVLVICLVWSVVHLARDAGTADAAEAQPAAVTPPAPTVTPEAALAAAVQERTDVGRVSVAVTDLSTGREVGYAPPGDRFATASVVKVDILATLLLQRQGRLTDAQRRTARRMIEVSDNGAATTLWREIGGAKGLAAANERFGLTGTVPGTRARWGVTTTTAADQLRLLRTVFTADSPLDEPSRAYAQSLLGRIAPDQDWGVPAADTRSGQHYHVKDGWLPRDSGWVVTSVGAIEHQGRPLLVAVLADGQRSKGSGVKLVESVAQDAARVVTST